MRLLWKWPLVFASDLLTKAEAALDEEGRSAADRARQRQQATRKCHRKQLQQVTIVELLHPVQGSVQVA